MGIEGPALQATLGTPLPVTIWVNDDSKREADPIPLKARGPARPGRGPAAAGRATVRGGAAGTARPAHLPHDAFACGTFAHPIRVPRRHPGPRAVGRDPRNVSGVGGVVGGQLGARSPCRAVVSRS